MKIKDHKKFLTFLVLLIAGCSEGKVEYSEVCNNMEWRVAIHVESIPFYSIQKVEDASSYEMKLAEQIIYFEKRVEEMQKCMFSEANDGESKNLPEMDGVMSDLTYSLAVLRSIKSDKDILRKECDDCAPNLINLLVSRWSR